VSPPPTVAGAAGGMALEDGGRVDFGRLRRVRRERLLEAMGAAGLHAVVLGRAANVRYASGARQLWRAGASPFAPTGVVVRETGRVHLLSVWDDGIPPEIAHEDLYGISWNPQNLLGALRNIPGLADASMVGTDSLTPFFGEMFRQLAPNARLVDASGVMSGARATKTPEEVACIAGAATIAEAGLAALRGAVVPGVTERQLLGVFAERISGLGAPTPPSEGVVFATPGHGLVRFRNGVTDRPVGDNELVVLTPGALYAGYEGGLGRTVASGPTLPAGTSELVERCRRALDALVAACRPGNTGRDLYAAWEATGEPAPVVALAHGIGIGAEEPLIGYGRGAGAAIVPGSVLSVQAWITAEGTGGYLLRDLVLVGADGPEVLTKGERAEG
jgi:Xaa-Pro dipeptidase